MTDGLISGTALKHDFLRGLAGPADSADLARISTCIQCGSCSSSCVAARGMNKTPRQLWHAVQLGLADDVLASDDPWHCTTCSLCEKRCPRGIPLGSILLSLRALKAAAGQAPAATAPVLAALATRHNITGDPPENRLLWLDNMGLNEAERAGLFRDRADCVYFTGCVGALFPQVYKIPQSLCALLMRLDADFTLLDDEWCCGYPFLAAGQSGENLVDIARHQMEAICRKQAKTVIVSCPTCTYMFTKVYPQLLGQALPFRVLHYSAYLAEQIGRLDGRLIQDPVSVTYHDPCDLGRKLHITAQPRELLRQMPGVSLTEMRFAGEEGKCCGGGGNLEMTDPELAGEIAAERVREALTTGAACLLTSCQQCRRTLQNAARKLRARIKVYDLLEFLAARLIETDGGANR
jgi:heterodisulfide reductase subunit D